MEALESIEVAFIQDVEEKCPFKESAEAVEVELEDIKKDDLPSVQEIQDNNGGTLGRNLENASNGKAGTVNAICAAPTPTAVPRVDTRHNSGGEVNVKKDQKDYRYSVAAHHLIPGEASLAPSRLYKKYMVEGGKVTTKSGKEHEILANIGYNVNGAHNGVWLPGNYAIRATTSPNPGVSWGELGPEWDDWCFDYMCACVVKAGGQFHDSHTGYSEKVLAYLNKLHRALVVHQDACQECQSKDKIPPPYPLKNRLYQASIELRGFLKTIPGGIWKLPWCTSDRFKADLLKHKIMSF